MTAAERTLHGVAIVMDAAHLMAGWDADSGVLFVPALSEARSGDDVAIRIGIAGQATRATLFGRVKVVRRLGRPSLPPGVEITVAPASLPAARFLAFAARAGHVDFKERAPRYLLAREILVKRAGSDVRCVTRNVSSGGCALTWTAPLPACGEVLTLMLRHSLFSGPPRGVVCWTSPEGSPEPAVGLRITSEGFAARAWRALAAEAARTSGSAT